MGFICIEMIKIWDRNDQDENEILLLNWNCNIDPKIFLTRELPHHTPVNGFIKPRFAIKEKSSENILIDA